ncbi:MAG: aminotransferase class IV, partial [Flavobacteriales bacterium]|nr:aminotransferase class IV [Flavobacteriales bacterium]
LSQIKSNNVLLHSIAGSVARDKLINNIVLVNEKGCITEAVNANIFIVKDDIIITPKLSDGCVDGIMRKNVIGIIKKQISYKIEVRSIDKNELHSCDEIFITNSIIGIQSVYKYKSTNYSRRITSRIKALIISNISSLLDQQES